MRISFIFFIVILLGFLVILDINKDDSFEMPVFLKHDEIASNHFTTIKVATHSLYKPSADEMAKLLGDYSKLWAHLNYLWATNDVKKGKEYYTEDWFKQICKHYDEPQFPKVTRSDLNHDFHIINWAWDALVCTAIDSNIVFQYSYPDSTVRNVKVNLAIVLLLQGDNWRIDALRIIDENPIFINQPFNQYETRLYLPFPPKPGYP